MVVTRLAHDLRAAFPEMSGFSERNLRFMRQLALAWPDEEVVKRIVSLLPWGHNIRLMQKLDEPDKRLWYLQRAVEHGWSRPMTSGFLDAAPGAGGWRCAQPIVIIHDSPFDGHLMGQLVEVELLDRSGGRGA